MCERFSYNSIAWPKEPKATGGTAENMLVCELSPLLENLGEKTSRLLFWEFELPLYVKCDAKDALLQIPWTQAQHIVGAVSLDKQVPSV